MTRVGVVVIGRNEGERLRRCLESVLPCTAQVVYVDSGSTDGSVALAHQLGANVLELDMTRPFTAARARNSGLQRLAEIAPDTSYVQFVDGDCELQAGWLDAAHTFLAAHADIAMVCGRLRERHPERSIYNRLCDIEWDTPVGKTKACGGIAMARLEAMRQASGFREGLIAGEEPELCVRLRAAGWRIWRLDAEMAWHDAAMMRFGQWWRRAMRAGHAYAEGAMLHGHPPERHWVRESLSAWAWGLGIPFIALVAVAWLGWAGLSVLSLYPLQMLRLWRRGTYSTHTDGWRAFFLVLGKIPEAIGQLKFHQRRWLGSRLRLIEYK